MSSHAVRHARRPSRARLVRRRRLAAVLVAALLGAALLAVVTGAGPLGEAVREITLPLRHDDIIRQQARDKDLDAALIAAVIYEESRFRDQTSHAGARGLMQITPATADFIASRTGGFRFEQADLATPQINIAYGAWFLRYLIDHYDGNEELAVAAYNAGLTNVDGWVAKARRGGRLRHRRAHPVPRDARLRRQRDGTPRRVPRSLRERPRACRRGPHVPAGLAHSRRRFLLSAGGVAVATAMGGPQALANGDGRPRRPSLRGGRFLEGVLSGDPAPNAITLWTRVADAEGRGTVELEVARDRGFRRVVARELVRTSGSSAHAVKARVTGLRAPRGVLVPLLHARQREPGGPLSHRAAAGLQRDGALRLLLLPAVHLRLLPRPGAAGRRGHRLRREPGRLHLRRGLLPAR